MTARCATASAWAAMPRTARVQRTSRALWVGPWTPARARALRTPDACSRSSSRAGATARRAGGHCLAVPRGVRMRTSPRA
eukprot:13131856-Alexandrium_andersonii.AAC.1